MLNKKGKSYYFCWTFFIAFVIFLYGPTFTIVVLSFQGPEGGLTFPMNGFSFHWFQKLWEGGGYVDIGSAFRRSIFLGLILMILTVLLSLSAGMAFRKKFFGFTNEANTGTRAHAKPFAGKGLRGCGFL